MEAAIKFVKSVSYSVAAIRISWRFKAARDFGERDLFAENLTPGLASLHPGKMRRVFCGIDVGQPAPSLAGGAHFTFMTTSVRSSKAARFAKTSPLRSGLGRPSPQR